MAPKRALLAVNIHSRQGGTAVLDDVRATLRAAGIECREAPPDDERPLPDLIRHHAADIDLVVLGGGDGTMNLAADALLERGLPLGVLPLGTGNDLARSLRLPLDPHEAAEVIAAGHTQRIDLGRANGKAFFNVASLGVSVDVAAELTREMKRRWGKLGYPIAVLKVLRRGRSFSVRVRCDGEKLKLRAIQVAVGNGRHYGGGVTINDEAEINDGLLHVYALKQQPLWRLALRARHFFQGHHDDPASAVERDGLVVELRTKRPMKVNTDGEVTTETPVRLEVLPQALEVYVPADRRLTPPPPSRGDGGGPG